MSLSLGVSGVVLGLGAFRVHGIWFGTFLVGAGLAFVVAAWGIQARRAWAATLAGLLGLVTAILAVLALLVGAVAFLDDGHAIRLELPVIGAMSGLASAVLIGVIAGAGVFVGVATRRADSGSAG